MPWPLIGALAGGAIAAGASALGQARANRATREMAREQMAFQERMSSTSYRRAMEDLRLAGLNPMLAMTGGASSPGGAMASMQDVLGPAVSSAMSAARLKQELRLMKQQGNKIWADEQKTWSEKLQIDKITEIMSAGVKGKDDIVTPYGALSKEQEYEMLKMHRRLLGFEIPAARILRSKPASYIRALLGGSALSTLIRR